MDHLFAGVRIDKEIADRQAVAGDRPLEKLCLGDRRLHYRAARAEDVAGVVRRTDPHIRFEARLQLGEGRAALFAVALLDLVEFSKRHQQLRCARPDRLDLFAELFGDLNDALADLVLACSAQRVFVDRLNDEGREHGDDDEQEHPAGQAELHPAPEYRLRSFFHLPRPAISRSTAHRLLPMCSTCRPRLRRRRTCSPRNRMASNTVDFASHSRLTRISHHNLEG